MFFKECSEYLLAECIAKSIKNILSLHGGNSIDSIPTVSILLYEILEGCNSYSNGMIQKLCTG